MKQQKLFLIIVIIFLFLGQGKDSRAAVSNKEVADATLTAYELGAAPADQPLGTLPRWRSSLGEIQQAATTLLETNSKLNLEARQIRQELESLQAQVEEQRKKNAALSDEIVKLRSKEEENLDPVQIARLKDILADRNHQIQFQQDKISDLKARYGSMDSRLALARLRVAGLEIDKKSKAVDVKVRDETAMRALRAEIKSLQDKIVQGENQVKLLEAKTAELQQVDNPYMAQMREVSAQNAALRERLSGLQADKNARQMHFEQMTSEKLKLEKDRRFLRVQKLMADRDVLQLKLKENSEKLYALKEDAAKEAQAAPEVPEGDINRLQKQNASIEDFIGNLRENVALLEYKVSTLQRYKDRNKKSPRK